MQALADDLRHAFRRLTAQRGTAMVAGGMLALAIGITSAMLTVVDHMLLRPVPRGDAANSASASRWVPVPLRSGDLCSSTVSRSRRSVSPSARDWPGCYRGHS